MFKRFAVAFALLGALTASNVFAQSEIPADEPPAGDPVMLADLSIASIQADPFTGLRITVQNRGRGNAGACNMLVNIACGTLHTEVVAVDPVPAGGSRVVVLPLDVACLLSHGYGRLAIFAAKVDCHSQVTEALETNNVKSLYWTK